MLAAAASRAAAETRFSPPRIIGFASGWLLAISDDADTAWLAASKKTLLRRWPQQMVLKCASRPLFDDAVAFGGVTTRAPPSPPSAH